MRLFAVTWQDSTEPWGVAVVDNILYRTPAEVCDALNNEFDEWVKGCKERIDYERSMSVMRRNRPDMSDDSILAEEFMNEHGVAIYTLKD